ncbi:hypothetical protein [Arsenophonus endosymbiont of Aleurodicus floccissimus]|uniref:hypothetical protein n=1 Tax=Arsenophonus endosymbiont of Aleurodicus floccissimus TaxID=2152761 RepID=UPI0015FF82CF|nr:hypothetical protein [Arsenophonus endosymbiont of Aleurodicus floccissimus]
MYKSGHCGVSYLVGQQEVTACHFSLTDRYRESHLKACRSLKMGVWQAGVG